LPRATTWSKHCASLGVFTATCIANWVIFMFLPDLNHYFKVLSLLSLVSLGMALWVVKRRGPTLSTLNIVVGGLCMSYWWAMQYDVTAMLRTLVSLFRRF
jgi:hypothetical protein